MGGNRDRKKDKKKKPTESRKQDRKKHTDGPNGGVRIGSHRHRQKLRAAERRERDAAAAAAPTAEREMESTAATTTTTMAEATTKPSTVRNRRIRQRGHTDQRQRPKEVEYDPAKVQREAEMREQAVDADRELRRKIAQARQKQADRTHDARKGPVGCPHHITEDSGNDEATRHQPRHSVCCGQPASSRHDAMVWHSTRANDSDGR